MKADAHYQHLKPVDFLFASVNGGANSTPLLAGAVFENSRNGTVDIEFVSFSYSKTYLTAFVGSKKNPRCMIDDLPFTTRQAALEHVFKYYRDIFEGLYPSFLGS
jgi:hypothetical protein